MTTREGLIADEWAQMPFLIILPHTGLLNLWKRARQSPVQFRWSPAEDQLIVLTCICQAVKPNDKCGSPPTPNLPGQQPQSYKVDLQFSHFIQAQSAPHHHQPHRHTHTYDHRALWHSPNMASMGIYVGIRSLLSDQIKELCLLRNTWTASCKIVIADRTAQAKSPWCISWKLILITIGCIDFN